MFDITPSSFWELCFWGKGVVRQRQTKTLPKTQKKNKKKDNEITNKKDLSLKKGFANQFGGKSI